MTKTKQPLDLYIPTVSDIISIGGPEGNKFEQSINSPSFGLFSFSLYLYRFNKKAYTEDSTFKL